MKLKTLLTAIVLSVAIFTYGCKKEKEQEVLADPKASIENYENLHRFVSIAFNIPSEELKFDVKTQSFIWPNTPVRMTLKDIQSLYASANIYKDHYEK